MKCLDVIGKHRGKRERPEALKEGRQTRPNDCQELPFEGPVERVGRVIRWLWHQYSVGARRVLDEVTRAQVSHDFSTWENFHMQLLLERTQLLE